MQFSLGSLALDVFGVAVSNCGGSLRVWGLADVFVGQLHAWLQRDSSG